MSHIRIPFAQLEWTPVVPLESKKNDGRHPVTLLEFAPGFSDPNWCVNGHVAYILSGALEIEYEDARETYSEGDAFLIDRGTRHRASNPGERAVRLFIATRS